MKKAPTASWNVITLVRADWYGSDSSELRWAGNLIFFSQNGSWPYSKRCKCTATAVSSPLVAKQFNKIAIMVASYSTALLGFVD